MDHLGPAAGDAREVVDPGRAPGTPDPGDGSVSTAGRAHADGQPLGGAEQRQDLGRTVRLVPQHGGEDHADQLGGLGGDRVQHLSSRSVAGGELGDPPQRGLLLGQLDDLGADLGVRERRRHEAGELLQPELGIPSGRGRPSIPPDVVAAVMVLQTLYGLSDRDAADAVTFDLRWKAACGIAVDARSFHHSTLTYWRRRLGASDRPHRIFEVVRQLIIETGAIRGKWRRALDSTVLDDAVARQDTVTQLIAAVRRVALDVASDMAYRHGAAHGVADQRDESARSTFRMSLPQTS